MKYLFDAIEDRMNEFRALTLKGRKLYVGFESADVSAVKPYTELNAKLRDRLDTFTSDVEVWDLGFRFHSDDMRTIDAHDWVDGMTAAFKDADIESGVFQTAGCRMTGATVPNLTNGLFDASIGFELTIQREQGLPIPGDAGTGIAPATLTFGAAKDVHLRDTPGTTNHDAGNLKIGVGVNVAGVVDRTLLHFALTGVPVGATVTSASLILTGLNPTAGPAAAKVRRLTQTAWVENQATWNVYATGLSWAAVGGDATDVGEVDWTLPTGSGEFTLTGLAALCQDALDSRSGQLHILLRNVDENTNGRNITFRDSEYNPVPGQRPSLSVSYA
jgi:hypothetical protein